MNVYLDTKITLNILYCVHKIYKNIKIYKNKYKSVENNIINFYELITINYI